MFSCNSMFEGIELFYKMCWHFRMIGFEMLFGLGFLNAFTACAFLTKKFQGIAVNTNAFSLEMFNSILFCFEFRCMETCQVTFQRSSA